MHLNGNSVDRGPALGGTHRVSVMHRVTWLIVVALSAWPVVATAQSSVSGSAEWSVAQTDNVTDTQANSNGAFWQNYAVGLHSWLFDPRILKYDSEVTFRTNRQNATASNLADQQGRQRDLGFRLGAFLLPSGAFPFFVQASRMFTGTSGELTFSNPVPGAMAAGTPLNAFETEDRRLSLGGQLKVPGWPRAEVAFQRGDAIVTGGAERAEQRNDDLSGSVTRETSRTRHSVRYQRTGYEYALAQSFSQRVDNLDYDFAATWPGHLQLNARAGMRGTAVTSSLVAPPLDPGDRPYAPPPATDGRSDTHYATGGISYEPNARFAVRLNGVIDQQRAAINATSARLATGVVHAEVVRGLSLNAEATSGQRGQIIGGVATDVTASNGVAGITYSGGPRWLNGTLTANAGRGINYTPDGARGETRSSAREASLSSSMGWFALGAGYQRMMSQDAILDYGNFLSERRRASFTVQSARLSLNASGDRVLSDRGLGETFARHRQDTLTATLTARLWHEVMLTGTAGGFRTTYATAAGDGIDQALFWGGGLQSTLRRSLRIMAWVRSEDTTATSTHFDQRGLSGLARLEYRLRTLNFAVEYRHNYHLLQYGGAPVPTMFRGHQYRFSLMRQFGFGL
jgi:hypothetical protein